MVVLKGDKEAMGCVTTPESSENREPVGSGAAESVAAHQRECEDERIPTLRWYRWHFSLAFWRLLRRPFLRRQRWTRTELWLIGRAVNAQRRLFGWTD